VGVYTRPTEVLTARSRPILPVFCCAGIVLTHDSIFERSSFGVA